MAFEGCLEVRDLAVELADDRRRKVVGPQSRLDFGDSAARRSKLR
jgi:hypothetical protein